MEIHRSRQYGLAAHQVLFLCPPCSHWTTVMTVCNGFCQWYMTKGTSWLRLLSTRPSIRSSSLNGCCQGCSWVYVWVGTFQNMSVWICVWWCVRLDPYGHVNSSEHSSLWDWQLFISVIKMCCYVNPSIITSSTPFFCFPLLLFFSFVPSISFFPPLSRHSLASCLLM